MVGNVAQVERWSAANLPLEGVLKLMSELRCGAGRGQRVVRFRATEEDSVEVDFLRRVDRRRELISDEPLPGLNSNTGIAPLRANTVLARQTIA